MANYSMSSFEDSYMGQVALEKAKELFAVCDTESKGFIIKRDMQRLQNELPGLSPDQLEEVFDSLDQDKNGFLTPEEFVKGFGAFIGLQIPDDQPALKTEPPSLADEIGAGGAGANHNLTNPEDQERFQDIMENIGANEVFKGADSVDSVRTLWTRLRDDDPELLSNFENFLSNVSFELRKTKDDYSHLEHALKQKGQTHDEEVSKLYEEMEQQIRLEKERILEEERQKAQKFREDMERDLEEKDQQLADIVKRHHDLESKFSTIATTKSLTQQENEELQKERSEYERQKDQMESDLEAIKRAHEEAKDQLDNIKKQTKEEKKRRAKESLKVTQGIASERENLVKELDDLRVMNKRLQDERDEIRNRVQLRRQEGTESSPSNKKPSVIGPYLRGVPSQEPALAAIQGGGGVAMMRDVEMDDEFFPGSVSETEELPSERATSTVVGGSLAAELASVGQPVPAMEARAPPLGGNEDDHTPDRIFKVVFVGDSGVGKTCFLHRFCHNRFRPSFNATIGVDFTVKNIRLPDRVVALQLWDTAGQERFRSITKQYFRKADGVVLVYDITTEASFLSLRNWMESVKDGVDDACVLCVVGNKVDMCTNESARAIKHDDAKRLAQENGINLFFEASASSGQGVIECMRELAIALQEREDQQVEDALKLDFQEAPKKKKCCGR